MIIQNFISNSIGKRIPSLKKLLPFILIEQAFLHIFHNANSKLPNLDSNQDQKIQRLLYYPYTIGQCAENIYCNPCECKLKLIPAYLFFHQLLRLNYFSI